MGRRVAIRRRPVNPAPRGRTRRIDKSGTMLMERPGTCAGGVTPIVDAECLNGKRVLVVEDEALVAMLIEQILEDHGAVIAGTVGSVAEALAAIEREPPDAATLDGNLVGELSGPVANMLAKRGIPYLLVTGFIDMAVADPILQTAPRLAKPFTTAGFIEATVAHLC